KIMKKICLFLVFLIMITTFVWSANSTEKKVKIAYLPITHSLALLQTAKELQEQNGVKVELVKYGSWPELLDALNTGKVDGASVLIELAMKSKENGAKIKAVALGHKDGNVVIVSKNINNVSDLKGKTFAIPHRQSSHHILLQDTLKRGGLSTADINLVELPPTEMPSALASGTIDGYSVAEPFGAISVAIGTGKVLFTSEELWENSLCCALVFTDEFINSNENIAKKILSDYKKAGKSLNIENAKKIAKEFFKQKDEVLDISLQWIAYDDLEITKDTYEELVKKVKEYKLSDNPPSYDDFVRNDL
ncbi:MAG: ABC transporter substrate-binding protein, partial [Campylobacter sp.]|nr:ABC transporter substrate-binding protein [Campylobacter sp.]